MSNSMSLRNTKKIPQPSAFTQQVLIWIQHFSPPWIKVMANLQNNINTRRTWHCWICPILVHILPVKSHLSCDMEWLLVQTLHTWHWCPSRLCTGAPSVLPLYQISRLCNCITRFFISLLCRRHPAIPLFPLLWQSPDCNAHIWMSGRRQHLDICPSPEA